MIRDEFFWGFFDDNSLITILISPQKTDLMGPH